MNRTAVQSLSFYSLGALLLLATYFLTFAYVGQSASESLASSAGNVAPAYLLGLVVCAAAYRLIGAAWPVQATAHVLAAALFTWTWYAAARFGFAATDWFGSGVFRLTWLPGPALRWQLCQGVLLYGMLASTTYATRFAARAAVAAEQAAGAEPTPHQLKRFLTRQGEQIEPIDIRDIIVVNGADDYSEVVTRSARHLIRLSLTQLENRLPAEDFIRVHRSKIINFDRLLRAEPAGSGRFLLHLENGETAVVSRSGSQRLRERIF